LKMTAARMKYRSKPESIVFWKRHGLPISLLTITIVLYTMDLYDKSKIYFDSSQRHLDGRRMIHPVMNTYFNSKVETDAEILALWEKEWNNAGFTTKILTIYDARRHPKFEEYKKIIEGDSDIDASSFYKWLAMSSSGGGWMSTYETFPTNFPLIDGADLPNDGKLSCYLGQIPSLVSGTAEEWDRILEMLFDTVGRVNTLPNEEKTDRSVLAVLKRENKSGIDFAHPDYKVQRGFMYDLPRQVNCDEMSSARAVYIPQGMVHEAVNKNLYPVVLPMDDPTGYNHRAVAFKIYLGDFESQCGDREENVRPIMHTFFHKVKRMTTEDETLKVWREEWGNAGFETVVLTLDDAKKHPDFEEIEKLMKPLFGSEGYNALCFYRWMAMAVVGGGWMSDHDTLPLNFPIDEGLHLPNAGNFTSFQTYVPSLMSGTEEEWNRVFKLLIDAIPRINDGPDAKNKRPSDMHAFEVLHREKNGSIIFSRYDAAVHDGYIYKSPHKVDCKKLSGRAVHLSHAYTAQAIKDGLFPVEVDDGVDEPTGVMRAQGAKLFLNEWKFQCAGVSTM